MIEFSGDTKRNPFTAVRRDDTNTNSNTGEIIMVSPITATMAADIIFTDHIEPIKKRRPPALTYHESLRTFLDGNDRFFDYFIYYRSSTQRHKRVMSEGSARPGFRVNTAHRKTVKSLTPIRRNKQRRRK